MLVSFFAGKTNFGVDATGWSDLVYSVNSVAPDASGNVAVTSVNGKTVNSNVPANANFTQYDQNIVDLDEIQTTLLNLSATPSDVISGKIFVGANGAKMTGTR